MSVKTSWRPTKKFVAEFYNRAEDKHKTVHFGLAGAEDYTIHKDAERAERYRKRHEKDLDTEAGKTGMSPGALSYFVLWTSPSFEQGVRNFKKEFSL
jgi:hypothetical protein